MRRAAHAGTAAEAGTYRATGPHRRTAVSRTVRPAPADHDRQRLPRAALGDADLRQPRLANRRAVALDPQRLGPREQRIDLRAQELEHGPVGRVGQRRRPARHGGLAVGAADEVAHHVGPVIGRPVRQVEPRVAVLGGDVGSGRVCPREPHRGARLVIASRYLRTCGEVTGDPPRRPGAIMDRVSETFVTITTGLDYSMLIVDRAGRRRPGRLSGRLRPRPASTASVLWSASRTRTAPCGWRCGRDTLGVHFLSGEQLGLAQLFGSETTDEIDTFSRCRWHPIHRGRRSR